MAPGPASAACGVDPDPAGSEGCALRRNPATFSDRIRPVIPKQFGHLFLGNPSTLACLKSADSNIDATIDITDGIAILQYLFNGGPPPAAPVPPEAPCGVDVDAPGSAADLGCEEYRACR